MNNTEYPIPNTRFAITGATRLTGVIGWPVGHSLSPQMHNAAFAALGLDWVYVPLPVRPERLEAAVRGLAALGFVGANVTVPHKEAVLPLLDELTPTATAIGAVNTIVVRPDGTLLGDNTDAAGFLADLRAHGYESRSDRTMSANGKAHRMCQQISESANVTTSPCHPVTLSPCHLVTLIGAGGAARAVAYALTQAGATVAVVNRTVEHGKELCRIIRRALPQARISAHPFPAALPALAPTADLIVNATSLGLHADDPLPWDAAIPFRPGQIVYDLIYSRPTPLLALAEQCGARAISGLGMLVHQGARAFELWTERPAPVDVMRRAVEIRRFG